MQLFHQVFVIGSALSGIAIVLFAIIWSARLRALNEARLEFVIPCAFTVSFLLYFVILLTKESGLVVLLLVAAMCFGSMHLARGGDACPPFDAGAEGRAAGHRGLRSFTLLAFASWVQIAFFRVLSTPELSGNRFTHYLIPFSFACVTSLVMLLLCMRMSRYLNVSLAYRWSLPLFMLSYVPIFIDYGNPTLRLAAYAINFLGMFGVQFGCWLGACKYLRRTGSPALTVFGVYALGEGLGIFLGCLAGLYAVLSLDEKGLMVLSSVLLTAVAFAIMVTGFNPQWVFNRTRSRGEDGAAGATGADGAGPALAAGAHRPRAQGLRGGRRGGVECRSGLSALAFAPGTLVGPFARQGKIAIKRP